MKALTKIAAALALTASAGAMALPAGFGGSSVLSNNNGGPVGSSVATSSVCNFAPGSLTLGAASIYKLPDDSFLAYATPTDASIGSLSVAGHTSVTVATSVDTTNLTPFDTSETITTYVGVNGLSDDDGSTDVTLDSAATDLTIDYVAAGAASGFSSVGVMDLTVTVTCL